MSEAQVVVGVALKSVDVRPDVDPLTGVVTTDPRWRGLSAADEAALEVALELAEAWGGHVVAVTVGDEPAEGVLRAALAVGAGAAVRLAAPPDTPSAAVADALASAFRRVDARVVVCGTHSLDRGSGSVPAFLARHLGAAQALGLVAIESVGPIDEGVRVLRRLDGGRRERLRVATPAVLSVEGSVARLRRASLAAALASESAPIEVAPEVHGAAATDAAALLPVVGRRAFRPRARVLPSPTGGTRDRILQLTDAATPRTPPRVVELGPEAAADEILRQLREWGELDADEPAN